MLVGTFVLTAKTEERAQDTQGGQQGHNKQTLSAQKSAGGELGEPAQCLLYLWRPLSGRARKTEQSLKFVVCGDASPVKPMCATDPRTTLLHLLSSCRYAANTRLKFGTGF